MRTSIQTLALSVLTLVPMWNAHAEEDTKATREDLVCGPPSWANPKCPLCKEAGKSYVGTKFVEGAIDKVHENFKNTTDPKPEVEALTAVIGVPTIDKKRWEEQGAKNGEVKETYCWDAVKAEAIKPLKDGSYGIGSFYFDHCQVDKDVCYQMTMECGKARDENTWICNPSLQEFRAKDGKCVDSPVKDTCSCQPGPYWKCGLNAGKGGASSKGKKGKK